MKSSEEVNKLSLLRFLQEHSQKEVDSFNLTGVSAFDLRGEVKPIDLSGNNCANLKIDNVSEVRDIFDVRSQLDRISATTFKSTFNSTSFPGKRRVERYFSEEARLVEGSQRDANNA